MDRTPVDGGARTATPAGGMSPDLGVRRVTAGRLVAAAALVGLLVAVVAGFLIATSNDHGSAVAVRATPLHNPIAQTTNHGYQTTCRTTLEVTTPRHAVDKGVLVSCGVSKGVPTGAYLYADGTITTSPPASRVSIWVVSFVVAVLLGLGAFVVLAVIAAVGLWIARWREER